MLGPEYERRAALANALGRAVDIKGAYYPSHSQGVEALARRIAERMGFTPEHASDVAQAGLLHDVGKLALPDAILLKPGRLTDDEFAMIRRHPSAGCNLLLAAGFDVAAIWVLRHHERPDGRGYPDGLADGEIAVEAQVIAVADAFHAITSSRPYDPAHSPRQALDEIERHAGTQFAPPVVEALAGIVAPPA